MSSKNQDAWEQLFKKYDILNQVNTKGLYCITSDQIKEFREPRLMVKFDHSINLPKIFSENSLAILPDTRGSYIIANFDVYKDFEKPNTDITKFTLPSYLQSINSQDIHSESVALNCAYASGIIADFLEEDNLVPTIAGRMGSGKFTFRINNSKTKSVYNVDVQNSQIEIDAAFEGTNSFTIFEAKCNLSDDFLIRQLYYPLRCWQNNILKKVRLVFFIYSNGIFRLYEYELKDLYNYNSLYLKKQKNYAIEDTFITLDEIKSIYESITDFEYEPSDIPFPQADKFERVINLCELLSVQELNRDSITENYAFDVRQTNYYTDAARYLGLIVKRKEGYTAFYNLTELGRATLNIGYKERQLAYCNLILSHKAFYDTFTFFLVNNEVPTIEVIIEIMKNANLNNVEKESTFRRRAQTVKHWLNWIIKLNKTK